MRHTPLNRVFNSPAHAVLGREEYRANLAPAQPLGPGRQVPAVGGRQLILAVTPWHHLHSHPTPFAVNPLHPIGPEVQNAPDEHELESPFLKAIAWSSLPTTTQVERTAVPPRFDLDHQRWLIVVLLQAHLTMDKRLELLYSIEDRLNTHSGALSVLMKRGNSILTDVCLRMRSPLIGPELTFAFPPAFTIASPSTNWGETMVKMGGRTLLPSWSRVRSMI
jgi:hypothetical protein